MDEPEPFRFAVPALPLGEEATGSDAWVTVLGGSGKRLPFSIQITVGVADDGRLVCTGLRTPPGSTHEVTARSLRQLPLSQILAALVKYRSSSEGQRMMAERFGLWTAVEAAPAYERPHLPRGYRIPREHFEHVAEVYREALQRNPRHPYSYVTAALQTTTPTARRWVQRARDMGLLGEARRGRPGEHPRISEDGAKADDHEP